MSAIHMNNEDSTWNIGLGKVIRPNMTCTCQGSSCSCISKGIAYSVLDEEIASQKDFEERNGGGEENGSDSKPGNSKRIYCSFVGSTSAV